MLSFIYLTSYCKCVIFVNLSYLALCSPTFFIRSSLLSSFGILVDLHGRAVHMATSLHFMPMWDARDPTGPMISSDEEGVSDSFLTDELNQPTTALD